METILYNNPYVKYLRRVAQGCMFRTLDGDISNINICMGTADLEDKSYLICWVYWENGTYRYLRIFPEDETTLVLAIGCLDYTSETIGLWDLKAGDEVKHIDYDPDERDYIKTPDKTTLIRGDESENEEDAPNEIT